MKKVHGRIIIAIALLMVSSICFAGFGENTRQALQEAVNNASADIARDPTVPAGETIGIMPITNDKNDFVVGILKSSLTKAGYKCVELKDSDFWEEIQDQFAWDTRKADILDQATLLEFKKLMGTQMLLYGVVREASENIEKVYVETEFHISSLETTRHVWGGVFSRRNYLTADTIGLVTLKPKVKEILTDVVGQVAKSMNAAPKLSDTKSMMVIEIAGDMENYVKGLLFEVMTNQTNFSPRDLGVRTLAEARQVLRSEPDRADAVLYGSIRNLSRKLKSELPLKKTYTITAELQFTAENVQTGDILWSVTQTDSIDEVIETPKDEAAYDWAKENTGTIKFVLIGIGVLVFFAFIMFISRPKRRR